MSVIDGPVTDAKAGYSTICRRGEHKTCAMAKARCTCSCHGRNGQTPPTPRPPEVPAMSEATVTALPSKPKNVICDMCGYTAVSANGLAVHRGRAHGPKAKPSSAPKVAMPAEPRRPAKQPADDRQLLAIVAQAYHDGTPGADIASSIDAAHDILDAVTNAGWRVVEA